MLNSSRHFLGTRAASRPADLIQIESVSMDMWGPYIAVVEGVVHDAEEKICFDKFHVAKHLLSLIHI